MSKSPTKDKTLGRTLFGLNIFSGCTTIVGATQIFPGFVGYIGGSSIQLLLFLLTSGSVARHAPMRKWLVVIMFSFLSIYTSFFAYYDFLTESNQISIASDKAVQAHTQLLSEVYTPLKKRLDELDSQLKTIRQQRDREIKGQDETGIPGYGPKAKALTIQANQLESKANQLSPIVTNLEKKFDYVTTGKNPEEILKADRQALGQVPQEYLPGKYKTGLDLQRSNYIDEEVSIKLLAPYHKIKRGEISAIASLLIAIIIDGLIIVLGTAIEVRRRQAPFEAPANLIASLIRGIKNGLATINYAIENEGSPILTPMEAQTFGLTESVNIVTLKLRGKGSEFLTKFYLAIDPVTQIIAHEDFLRDSEPTFVRGFRMLLDELRNPQLRWVKVKANSNNYHWHISDEKSYSHLVIWLRQEIHRQCELEANESEEFFSSQARNIEFQLPIRT